MVLILKSFDAKYPKIHSKVQVIFVLFRTKRLFRLVNVENDYGRILTQHPVLPFFFHDCSSRIVDEFPIFIKVALTYSDRHQKPLKSHLRKQKIGVL